LQYDQWNRPTQVSTPEGHVVQYRYNGNGQLYERTENGITTRYYYDGDHLIAEAEVTNGAITLKARYLYGREGLIARISADPQEQIQYGGIAYYEKNGHGDIVGLRDPEGNPLNTYAYDIWGNVLAEGTQETIPNPFLYSGEYWDKTTELQYLRARWYDPSVGRFISEDTVEGQIDNPLSLNLYTYVQNNPLRYKDPTGHFMEDVFAADVGGGGCDCGLYYPENPPEWDFGEAVGNAILELSGFNDFVTLAGSDASFGARGWAAFNLFGGRVLKYAGHGLENGINLVFFKHGDEITEGNSNIKNLYNSIKEAPKYPNGFTAVKNGTKKVNIKNKDILNALREIEPGDWKKVYKDGYDANGRKISIHYFLSPSGKVFDVKVKSDWSNK
jgi:RHS repeat-associated protein